MKRIISLMVFIFLVSSVGLTQDARTETASNHYKYHNAATTGDTLTVLASTIASGSSIKYYNTAGFVVGIRIGYPVASDTIIIKSGVDTVYKLIQPASAPFIYNAEIQTHVDTSLIFVQKKNSHSTLIYRQRY